MRWFLDESEGAVVPLQNKYSAFRIWMGKYCIENQPKSLSINFETALQDLSVLFIVLKPSKNIATKKLNKLIFI